MADPIELTHEQLGWLLSCGSGAAPPADPALADWAKSVCWSRAPLLAYSGGTGRYGVYTLGPRGRELVDIAVRAVNAELRERGSRG